MKFENDFFDELGRGLLKTEYSDRLRIELEQHLEDATRMKLIHGTREEKARAEAVEDLGSAKEIRQTFNTVMRMRHTTHLFLEALFIAIISIPVVAIVNAAVPSIPFMFMEPGTSLTTVPLVILVLLALPLFFAITVPRLLRFADDRKTKLAVSAIVLAPVLLTVLPQATEMLSRLSRTDDPLSIIIYVVLAAVIPLTFDLFAFWIVVHFYNRRVARQMQDPQKIRTGWPTQAIICTPIIGYTVMAAVIRWTAVLLDIPMSQSALAFVLYPLELVERYASVVVGGLLESFPTLYVTTMWVICVGMILLISYTTYEIIRWQKEFKKKERHVYPWIQTLMLTYLITISIFGIMQEPSFEPSLPIKKVSFDIEQRMFSLFANQVVEFDRHLAKLAYQIKTIEGGFEITHETTGATYELTNIRSIYDYSITRVADAYDQSTSGSEVIESGTLVDGTTYIMLPYLHCEQADTGTYDESPTHATNDGLFVSVSYNPQDFLLCKTLSYNGETIYTSERPSYVLQAVITEDEHWLLLKLSADPFQSTDFLYLVDLRK